MTIIVRSMYNFVNCLQFNIRYEKVKHPAPVGGALVLNHLLLLSTGNKCFYANNFTAPMTWNNAVTFCRKFGPGYDIAAINNEIEQGMYYIILSL